MKRLMEPALIFVSARPRTRFSGIIALIFYTLFAGQSALAAINVSGIVNSYAAVSNISGNVVTIGSLAAGGSSTPFAVNDYALLIQMTGAPPAHGSNIGISELRQITGVSGSNITLASIDNSYDFSTEAVQLVRVPFDADITATANVTAMDWNGTTGGVIALKGTTLTLNADIDASGSGFVAGTNTNSAWVNFATSAGPATFTAGLHADTATRASLSSGAGTSGSGSNGSGTNGGDGGGGLGGGGGVAPGISQADGGGQGGGGSDHSGSLASGVSGATGDTRSTIFGEGSGGGGGVIGGGGGGGSIGGGGGGGVHGGGSGSFIDGAVFDLSGGGGGGYAAAGAGANAACLDSCSGGGGGSYGGGGGGAGAYLGGDDSSGGGGGGSWSGGGAAGAAASGSGSNGGSGNSAVSTAITHGNHYLNATNPRLLLGESGGSSTCADGGAGGGIVVLEFETVSGNSNTIRSDGDTAATTPTACSQLDQGAQAMGAGGGGGGGGGQMRLSVFSWTSTTVSAAGGQGGDGNNSGIYHGGTSGGGGGGGGIWFDGVASFSGGDSNTNGGSPVISGVSWAISGGSAGATTNNPKNSHSTGTSGAGGNGLVSVNLQQFAFDYGDTPQSYDGTAAAAATHQISNSLRLGTESPDGESVPAWSTDAEGDDTVSSGSSSTTYATSQVSGPGVGGNSTTGAVGAPNGSTSNLASDGAGGHDFITVTMGTTIPDGRQFYIWARGDGQGDLGQADLTVTGGTISPSQVVVTGQAVTRWGPFTLSGTSTDMITITRVAPNSVRIDAVEYEDVTPDSANDEDGSTFSGIGPGNAVGAGVSNSYTLNVDVTNSIGSDSMLAGWIDLNCDGVFSSSERAAGCFNEDATPGNCTPSDSRGALVATGNTPSTGKGVLYWDGGDANSPLMSQTLVDASCPTDGGSNPITYARIRLSSDSSFFSTGTISPTGSVSDGEIEDYVIPLSASTTPAVIAEVKAEAHGEAGTVVSWLSASERAASAFRLERWVESDAGNGHWQRVHDSPWIPALVTTQGGTYKVLDSPVEAGASQRYRIVERTQGGGHQSYGPFAVTAESVNAELPPLLGDFAAEARWDYDRIVAVTEARERSLKRKSPGAAALQRSDSGAKLQSEAPVRPKQLKLWVQDSGLYSLSLDQLVNAFGYSKGTLRYWLRKGRLSLQTGGEAVAYYVDDAYSLHFYGEAIDSLYTEERPYILTRQQSGLKMGALEVAKGKAVNEKFIDTTHLEEDAFAILSATTDPLADYWYMDSVATVNGFRSQSYEIAVPGARQSKGELRARVWSDFDGEHRVAVSANGGPIGELAFSGRGNQEVKLKLPKTVFSTETLQLELTLEDSPSDGFDVVFLDSLDVQYKRLSKADQGFLSYPAEADTRVMGFATAEIQTLDISNPKQPLWISGGKVWQRKAGDYAFRGILPAGDYHSTERRLSARVEGIAGSKLKARNNRADYVVISNGELMDAAEALAAYRSDKSFKTMVVEIDDIYNEFGHGIPDPAAIRSFIQASRRWKQAPAYVTLLGDGSFDYTNRLGTGYNLISPLMWPGVNGLFASDTLLGDVNGDGRPEVAVGRIPAKTLDAALAYIDKVRAYEADSAAYPALLLSDNADKGGDFLQSSNDIASRVAGSQLQLSLQGADLNQARDDLLAYLDGGVRLINYVGHGGVDRMSSEGWLLNTDADTMSNPITPSFVALTCIINNFAVAGYDSMAERMLMNPNGGVVTAWSASGESYNDAATVLGVEFHHHYSNSSRLGDAIVAALAEEQYLTSVYTLLGDSALLLQK